MSIRTITTAIRTVQLTAVFITTAGIGYALTMLTH